MQKAEHLFVESGMLLTNFESVIAINMKFALQLNLKKLIVGRGQFDPLCGFLFLVQKILRFSPSILAIFTNSLDFLTFTCCR